MAESPTKVQQQVLHLEHDLFLLMLNLAQLRDRGRIIELFVEAMNEGLDQATLRQLAPGEEPRGMVLKLRTRSNEFGALDLTSPDEMPDHLARVVRNAARMLAIILENRRQHELLDAERASLREEVEARTQALKESRERYQRLLETLAEGVWAVDRHGRTTYVNAAMAEMLGSEPESLLGCRVEELVDADDHRTLEEFLGDGTVTRRRPLTFRRVDGEEVHTLVSTSPMTSSNGTEVLLAVTDMTERQRLEEHLHQAQKMEAIGTLAGGIAHDFNNLLTGILGQADLLALDADPEGETAEAARVIEQAVERAAELTRQLLGFARRGKHQNVSVDLGRLIDEVLTLLGRTVDKRIRMIKHLDAESHMVHGDPGQLQQVLVNLAVNARDAMPEGGELAFETTNIRFTEESAPIGLGPGLYLSVTVSDTGVGISPEVKERIFEPFFTTKPLGAGTGMGLAMVYGIVRNHSGVIRVRGAPGQGASFTIILPLSSGEAVTVSSSPQSVWLAMADHLVLVVDDEETVRGVAGQMLRRLGYEVITARDGHHALEAFEAHRGDISLVLLDLTMPEMDGRVCFEALFQRAPKLPIVVSTGHAFDRVSQDLVSRGAAGFIQKPYTLTNLSEVVGRALRRR